MVRFVVWTPPWRWVGGTEARVPSEAVTWLYGALLGCVGGGLRGLCALGWWQLGSHLPEPNRLGLEAAG